MTAFQKTIFRVLLSAVLVATFTSLAYAANNSKSPESVEARLTERITKNLDLFLTKEDYRVFATAKIKEWREKIILEGETQKKSAGKEIKTAEEAKLPGFQNLEKPRAKASDVKKQEKAKYSYRNRSKLTSATVKLILKSSLAKEVKTLAQNTANDIIAKTVGNVGKLEVVELALTAPKEEKKTGWEWLTGYLEERGGSALDLFYLALLLVALTGALLGLGHYFRSKKATATTANSMDSHKNENLTQKEIDDQANTYLDNLIVLLNSSPLVTRNFLRDLEEQDKEALLVSLKTPALKGLFQRILNFNLIPSDEKVSAGTVGSLDRVEKDLIRYIQLSKEMETKPFGYIPQLTGNQVAQLINQEPNRVDSLHVIAPHLTDHQLEAVTKELSIMEKAEFLSSMRDEHGTLKSDLHLGSELTLKDQIDTRLRDAYNNLKKDAVLDVAETETLESLFLQSDEECIEVINILAKKHGKVPKAYEKYLVGFEDFLGLDLGIARKVMQRISNEVLSKALAERQMDSHLIGIVGEMRSQLIESIKKRDGKVNSKEIEKAKNEILKTYRALV